MRCCEVVEGGERTWFQFGLDSSKQLIGAGLEEVKCSIVLLMFNCAQLFFCMEGPLERGPFARFETLIEKGSKAS